MFDMSPTLAQNIFLVCRLYWSSHILLEIYKKLLNMKVGAILCSLFNLGLVTKISSNDKIAVRFDNLGPKL